MQGVVRVCTLVQDGLDPLQLVIVVVYIYICMREANRQCTDSNAQCRPGNTTLLEKSALRNVVTLHYVNVYQMDTLNTLTCTSIGTNFLQI